jgi:hypothetical protein
MRPECIQAVSQALGRQITQAQADKIELRIRSAQEQLWRTDRQNMMGLSKPQQFRLAAEQAAKDIKAEAAKKQQRVALTIISHDKLMTSYESGLASGLKPFASVAKILDQVSNYSKGVSNEYFANLMDTFHAVHPKFLGMVEDAKQASDLVREVFGEDSGNALSKKGAQAWLATVESMRLRFNAAGGAIGKLDYGYLPQPHDAIRVLKSGAEAWIKTILPLLDRSRYLTDDGIKLDDTAMTEMLSHAFETITTGGLNKLEVGKFHGNGMRANQGGEHRTIHFKDAESYLAYASQFNRGGILSAMQGHVSKLAKDIALVEEMSPNPTAQYSYLHDVATKTGATDLVGPWLVTTNNMWDVLNGNAGHVANVKLAEVMQGARNVEVFGKLGSALISSISDIPTYFATTGYNKLGFGESLTNLITAFGGDSKDYANRAGLVSESVISDMNRWAESNIGKGWTGKLANATMKASLLEAWTDALRRGFSVTMMGALGKISRLDWSALESGDKSRLMAKGINETDFKVWQMATPEGWRGSQMLTMQSLRNISPEALETAGLTLRDQHRAVSKMLGIIADESQYASLEQDLQTRAAVTRGTQKGTIEGETLRSLMLFKGFPMAMISRHWGRVAEQWRMGDKASSVGYGVGLTTAITIFGGIALELSDMINSKDPRDATTAKFWGAAMVKGGGIGILGDVLYTGLGGNNRGGQPNWASLIGPVAGSAIELANLTVGNIGQAAQGKDTFAGAEALRFAKSHLPFLNLWYAKSAIDHAGLHDLQELLSPGYLSRMRQSAHKDWGQDYYWQPGQSTPDRGPDLTKALGN